MTNSAYVLVYGAVYTKAHCTVYPPAQVYWAQKVNARLLAEVGVWFEGGPPEEEARTIFIAGPSILAVDHIPDVVSLGLEREVE